MKPLVYYSRWQGARLRLRGRDDTAVWGEFVSTSEDGVEDSQKFHFNLQTSELLLRQEDGESSLVLDEMGIPLEQPS